METCKKCIFWLPIEKSFRPNSITYTCKLGAFYGRSLYGWRALKEYVLQRNIKSIFSNPVRLINPVSPVRLKKKTQPRKAGFIFSQKLCF